MHESGAAFWIHCFAILIDEIKSYPMDPVSLPCSPELSAETISAIANLSDMLSAIAVSSPENDPSSSVGKWRGFGLLNTMLSDPAHSETYVNVVNALKRACEMNREELCIPALGSLQSVLDSDGPNAVVTLGNSLNVFQQLDTILGIN